MEQIENKKRNRGSFRNLANDIYHINVRMLKNKNVKCLIDLIFSLKHQNNYKHRSRSPSIKNDPINNQMDSRSPSPMLNLGSHLAGFQQSNRTWNDFDNNSIYNNNNNNIQNFSTTNNKQTARILPTPNKRQNLSHTYVTYPSERTNLIINSHKNNYFIQDEDGIIRSDFTNSNFNENWI